MRRLLRILLRLLLLLLILIEGLWLTRDYVLAPLARGPVESLLGGLLDAEVEIAEIGGDWPYVIEVRGIRIRSAQGPVRELAGGQVSAHLDPWRLIGGDLGGLREAHVRADRLALALPQAPPAEEPEEPGGAPPALGELLALLPEGASVVAREFSFTTPHGTRDGGLRIELEPAQDSMRSLLVDAAGVEVAATVGTGGDVSASATVVGVVDVAAVAGLAVDAQQGWLHANGELQLDPSTLAPQHASGSLVLRELQTARATVQESRIQAAWSGKRVDVEELRLHLPSLHAQGANLSVPLDELDPTSIARGLRGLLSVQVDSLEPFRELLPERVVALMPLQAQLAVQLHGDAIDVLAAHVDSAQGSIDVHGARLEFGGALWPPQRIAVDLQAQVAPGAAPPELVGLQLEEGIHVTGELTLAQPQGELNVEIPSGSYQGFQWQRASVGAQLEAERLTADLLAVNLHTDALPQAEVQQLELQGSLRVADLAPDLRSAQVQLRAPLVRVGTHELAVQAQARTTDAGIQLEELEMRSGDGRLTARGSLATTLAELAPDAPLQAQLAVEEFRLAALPVTLPIDGMASAEVTLGGTLSDPQLALAADAHVLAPLGSLVGLHVPAPEPPLELSVRAASTPEGIRLDRLSAQIGEERLDLQLAGTLPLALDFRQGPRVLDRGSIEGTLQCSWIAPQVGRVRLAAELFAGPDGIGIRDGKLTQELGEAMVEVALRRSLAELLAGTDPAGATVEGLLQLREFDLTSLPHQRFGLEQLAGKVDGQIKLAGELDPAQPLALLRDAELRLREGMLKFGVMPRLEDVRILLSADSRTITIQEFAASAGARPVSLDGSITAARGTLLSDPASATADLRIAIDDALLWRSRGVKLRAGVDATLRGTLEQMTLAGTATLASGKVVKRILLLPDLQGRGGESVAEGFELPSLPPEIGNRLVLDLKLHTDQPFVVRTSVLDTELRADLRLTGTAARPRLIGSVYGEEGVLRFPGGRLGLDELLVTFRADAPNNPDLQIAASGRRAGYTIDLRIAGSMREPEISVSSSPPLPTEDLLVLLSTGMVPARLREQSPRQHALLASSILAQQLLEDLFGSESTERGESFFDQITFEAGREISRNGVESLLVEVRLDDHFALEGERDVYEEWNAGVVLRFRFK